LTSRFKVICRKVHYLSIKFGPKVAVDTCFSSFAGGWLVNILLCTAIQWSRCAAITVVATNECRLARDMGESVSITMQSPLAMKS